VTRPAPPAAPTLAAALCATLALTGVAGCEGLPGGVEASDPETAVAAPLRSAPQDAVYRGVRTRLLDNDLVQFLVAIEGARDGFDAIAYARCAAAQYTLIRGYGFARHLRTNVHERGGIWQADAVYTVSPALPRGARTIDAEVTVAACTEQGIPTV
jgi:hypothetical protein